MDSQQTTANHTIYIMEKTPQQQGQGGNAPGARRCPYCGELISDTAVKCRHCGEWLDRQHKQPDNTRKKDERRTAAKPADSHATVSDKASEDDAKAKILFIGAGVAAVVVLALVLFLTYGNGGNGDTGTCQTDREKTTLTDDTDKHNNMTAEHDGENMTEATGADNRQTDIKQLNHDRRHTTTHMKNMLVQWDMAHNDRDAMAFAAMYANTVSYYGSEFTKRQCVANKRELFKRYDVYEQHSDNVSEERIAPGCVKLTFDKHVYYDGNSAVYRGYLFLEKDGSGTWRITKESDTTTDYNLSRKGR